MTYIRYPACIMYWSFNKRLRLNVIAESMPLKRYEEINKFLHFINNGNITDDNTDSYLKLRPLLDVF